MVVHFCNPSTQEGLRQENLKLKASLVYVERPYLNMKKKKKKRKEKRII
jgi:hypothetical protein